MAVRGTRNIRSVIGPHFFFFGILAPDFLAVLSAAATACRWGWPDFTISRIFSDMTFFDFPFFKGMGLSSKKTGTAGQGRSLDAVPVAQVNR